MKILALSDFHGDYSKVPGLFELAGGVDLVVASGDITDFGPASRALELVEICRVPLLAVPGNCDPRALLEVIDKSEAFNLHNTLYEFKGITFAGIGGSNPTPFNTPFEMSDEEIKGMALELLKHVKNDARLVLVSHAPPLDTLDEIGGRRVGSSGLTSFLGRAVLVICGHIHEARGKVEVEGTTVVNPGMASRGEGAVITLEEGGLEVDFIQTE